MLNEMTFFQRFRDALIPGTLVERSVQYFTVREKARKVDLGLILVDFNSMCEEEKNKVKENFIRNKILARAQRYATISEEVHSIKARANGLIWGIGSEILTWAPLVTLGVAYLFDANLAPEEAINSTLATIFSRECIYSMRYLGIKLQEKKEQKLRKIFMNYQRRNY